MEDVRYMRTPFIVLPYNNIMRVLHFIARLSRNNSNNGRHLLSTIITDSDSQYTRRTNISNGILQPLSRESIEFQDRLPHSDINTCPLSLPLSHLSRHARIFASHAPPLHSAVDFEICYSVATAILHTRTHLSPAANLFIVSVELCMIHAPPFAIRDCRTRSLSLRGGETPTRSACPDLRILPAQSSASCEFRRCEFPDTGRNAHGCLPWYY